MFKLALCGFMGSGKSYLCQQKNGLDFDHFLEKFILNQSISDFFAQFGEKEFRKRELKALEALFFDFKFQEFRENEIISLGGGALHDKTFVLLRQASLKTCWVDTPFAICWQRICEDSQRPLVSLGREALYKLYTQRKEFYRQCDFHLDLSTEESRANAVSLLDEKVKLTDNKLE